MNVVPEQAMVPYVYECSRTIYGDGETKAAFIHRDDIGRFVARIVADERTLNRYVFAYGGEATLHELFALAERITGRKIERRYVSRQSSLSLLRDLYICMYIYANSVLRKRGKSFCNISRTKELRGGTRRITSISIVCGS